jgi:hypothetical protein
LMRTPGRVAEGGSSFQTGTLMRTLSGVTVMKMGAVIHRNLDAASYSRVAEGGNSLQTKT